MTRRLQRFAAQRLFVRIFLWFWLSTVALIVTYALTSGGLRPAWGVAARELLPYVGARAADELEIRHAQGLAAYIGGVERDSRVKVFLLDANLNGAAGQAAPAEAQKAGRKAANNHAGLTTRTLSGTWLGAPVTSSSGARYFFVVFVPWHVFLLSPPAADPMWLPLVTITLIAGLMWYSLARKLAMPATALGAVARQFAAGDLSARVKDPRVFRHGDELSDLGREFNAMADRIEQSMVNQKRLIGDISHELGAPLARLRLAVGLARKQLGAPGEAPLDRIEKEAERLDELAQQVLDLLRAGSISAGAAQQVSLDRLLMDAVAEAHLEAAAKGCRVSIGAMAPCRVDIYPELMRSAIDNVIRNAVKYTAENSSVLVDLLESDGGACMRVRVRDQGPGVPEQSLPHLFEPFYRVNDARDRKSGGAGLGLSIARRAVERHGGTILARNRPEGGLEVDILLVRERGGRRMTWD